MLEADIKDNNLLPNGRILAAPVIAIMELCMAGSATNCGRHLARELSSAMKAKGSPTSLTKDNGLDDDYKERVKFIIPPILAP